MVGRPHYLKLLKNELHRSKDHGSRLFNTYDLGGALPFNIKTTQAGPWTRNSTPSGTPSSKALGEASISCNVLAGAYHDHILVPVERRDDALAVLRELRTR